ncbi:MAG TPA: hypothetical protein DD490_32435 [Acidobacteria bacterium]|nr:hypothetical protein [Acidobacteriota bacterium]
MSRVRNVWRHWLRRLRPEAPPRPDEREHPSVERLAAYQEDRLPPEEDGEIQEHFVACEECPELILDLDRFNTPESAERARASVPSFRVQRAWLRLSNRLGRDLRPRWPVLHWMRTPLLAWVVAALLAPCALLLWQRLEEVRREVQSLSAPELNPPQLLVDAQSLLRGGAPFAPSEIEVPAGAQRFLLVLSPEILPAQREHRLVLQTWDGEVLWRQAGLLPSADGTFVIGLSRRFLPGGVYRFRVTGAGGMPHYDQEMTVQVTYR